MDLVFHYLMRTNTLSARYYKDGSEILIDRREETLPRKLTPLECWRLMGWKNEQFEKIQGISDTQLYKQAGNGIVVNVLEAIFKNLFQEQENKCENCEKYNNFLCGKNGNYILPTMEIMMNCNR